MCRLFDSDNQSPIKKRVKFCCVISSLFLSIVDLLIVIYQTIFIIAARHHFLVYFCLFHSIRPIAGQTITHLFTRAFHIDSVRIESFKSRIRVPLLSVHTVRQVHRICPLLLRPLFHISSVFVSNRSDIVLVNDRSTHRTRLCLTKKVTLRLCTIIVGINLIDTLKVCFFSFRSLGSTAIQFRMNHRVNRLSIDRQLAHTKVTLS